jgi:hypothetical protein
LWVRHQDRPVETTVPALATDGVTLFYGADFSAWPLLTQTGAVAHAVLHVALRHPQRRLALSRQLGDVDALLFNLCADVIVNSVLADVDWLQLPDGSVRLEELLLNSLGISVASGRALLEWDVEALYRAIDDRRVPGAQAAASRGDVAGGWRPDGPRSARARALAQRTAPDLLPVDARDQLPEAEAEAAREWRERVLRAHSGDGIFSLLRVLPVDLQETRTPWAQLLRARLSRSLAAHPTPSWSRPTRSWIANQGRAGPNRRLPWQPGTSPTCPTPRLVVVVDVSGSIDDALMDQFAREVHAIVRRQRAALVVVVGDDQVRRIIECAPGQDGLAGITVAGRGGTDFAPLLREAERHRPDVVVVLTDLDGPAGHRPTCPVIWAIPAACAGVQAPFGRILLLS